MKEQLTPGYRYSLAYEGGTPGNQVLQFIEKAPTEEHSPELKLINDGTTTEAVIRVLIDRTQYLNKQFPSEYNTTAIEHLEEALASLEARTSDRQERNVEGKNII